MGAYVGDVSAPNLVRLGDSAFALQSVVAVVAGMPSL